MIPAIFGPWKNDYKISLGIFGGLEFYTRSIRAKFFLRKREEHHSQGAYRGIPIFHILSFFAKII